MNIRTVSMLEGDLLCEERQGRVFYDHLSTLSTQKNITFGLLYDIPNGCST